MIARLITYLFGDDTPPPILQNDPAGNAEVRFVRFARPPTPRHLRRLEQQGIHAVRITGDPNPTHYLIVVEMEGEPPL